MQNRILWFYASEKQFEKILNQGSLKPSSFDGKVGIKKAIWFSTNKKWEPVAFDPKIDGLCKMLSLTISKTFIHGMIRLGVNPKLISYDSWNEYKSLHLSSDASFTIELGGLMRESYCKDWFCSYKSIPLDQIKYFQKYTNGAFIDAELK